MRKHALQIWKERGIWPRTVATGLMLPIWAAVFAATMIIMLVSALASAAGRQVAYCWHRLGKRRRLIWGMVAAFPVASGAADLHLLPDNEAMILLAGGALAAFFGLWLVLDQALGRRRWRRTGPQVADGGGMVVGGSWRRGFAINSCRIDDADMQVAYLLKEAQAGLGRLEQVEAKVTDLLALMTQATEDVLPGWPDHEETRPIPRLRLLPQDSADQEAGSA
jgi:hypothetical protein